MESEQQIRIDLAAAFRLAAKFGWNESVANHFSATVDDEGSTFVMNPRNRHFSLVRASELLRLDVADPAVMDRPDPPDLTAWSIHGGIHRHVPSARVVLHCHPTYGTALAGLADPTIKPIDQNTARYFDRVAYDTDFRGMAEDDAEGRRLADVFGEYPVLMMGNHGVTVAAESVAIAFEELYYLEKACKTMVLAYSTGQPLAVLDDEVASSVSKSFDRYFDAAAVAHCEQQKARLDEVDPSYQD